MLRRLPAAASCPKIVLPARSLISTQESWSKIILTVRRSDPSDPSTAIGAAASTGTRVADSLLAFASGRVSALGTGFRGPLFTSARDLGSLVSGPDLVS